MSETVKVLCHKSKALSNGKHPLTVRICKDGKKKYLSLVISIHPTHWDFTYLCNSNGNNWEEL